MPDVFSEQMELFCREWLVDFNATQAAIRAGYSIDSARQIGSENLSKPSIKARIEAIRKDIDLRNGGLTQRLIDELSKIAFSNIQDYVGESNEVKDMAEIDRDQAAAVGSIKRSLTEFGDEDHGGTKTTVEFKLHDKVSAIEKLGRYVGLFENDNKQKSTVIRVIDEDE